MTFIPTEEQTAMLGHNPECHARVLAGIIRPLYPFLMKFSPRFRNAFGVGNNDMTVEYVENTFNVNYKTPPQSFTLQYTVTGQNGFAPQTFTTIPGYYSTSGNADLNGDHILESNEQIPYTFLQFPVFRYQRLSSVSAIPTCPDSSGRLVACTQPSTFFLDNDIAVTILSARYPKLTEIGEMLRNHATVKCGTGQDCSAVAAAFGNPDITPILLAFIRTAETQQP